MTGSGPTREDVTDQKASLNLHTAHCTIALSGMSIILGMGGVVLMFTFHRHYLWCSQHSLPLLSSIRHQVLRDPRPSFSHILLLWNQNKGFFFDGSLICSISLPFQRTALLQRHRVSNKEVLTRRKWQGPSLSDRQAQKKRPQIIAAPEIGVIPPKLFLGQKDGQVCTGMKGKVQRNKERQSWIYKYFPGPKPYTV